MITQKLTRPFPHISLTNLRGIILLLLIPCFYSYGQNSGTQKLYEAVPAQVRDSFIKRLELYIEYYRTNQHGKLYDLYSKETVAQILNGRSKVEYLEYLLRNCDGQKKISEFIPSMVKIQSADSSEMSYMVSGILRTRIKGRKKPREENAFIDVRFEDGEWRFSAMATVHVVD